MSTWEHNIGMLNCEKAPSGVTPNGTIIRAISLLFRS